VDFFYRKSKAWQLVLRPNDAIQPKARRIIVESHAHLSQLEMIGVWGSELLF
jgi:hypothetical protein